jgi:hypothetical protein
MEKRLNKMIETYTTDFKDKMKNKILEMNFEDKTKVNEILEFIYDYNRLVIEKEDLVKRKRIKNAIPTNNRCVAKRANGEQCTRRKKKECEFCGTHSKGVPNGMMLYTEMKSNENENIEVFAEDIKGIVYYIDKNNNVYKTEDILSGKENPLVISKCVKQDGFYTIPEFGLV